MYDGTAKALLILILTGSAHCAVRAVTQYGLFPSVFDGFVNLTAMLSGAAGLAHITTAAGIILFLLALKKTAKN